MEKDHFLQICQQINPEIFKIVQKFEGSISAEHGVGLTKKPYLNFSRSAEEIQYMQALKMVFDPKRIMNPGKIIDC